MFQYMNIMRKTILLILIFPPITLFAQSEELLYTTDVAHRSEYEDSNAMDCTYYYALHGHDKNYLYSQEFVMRDTKRTSYLTIPIFSYSSDDDSSIPYISISTDLFSLVRCTVSAIK